MGGRFIIDILPKISGCVIQGQPKGPGHFSQRGQTTFNEPEIIVSNHIYVHLSSVYSEISDYL